MWIQHSDRKTLIYTTTTAQHEIGARTCEGFFQMYLQQFEDEQDINRKNSCSLLIMNMKMVCVDQKFRLREVKPSVVIP